MLAYRVKKSKVCKNKFQKQTEIENSPKAILYRIYKNPQIVNSATRLNDFDVHGSTSFVIDNRNIK